MSKTQYTLDKPTIAVFHLLHILMLMKKIMHVFPSPNELMFSLTSSLLSRKKFPQIHGLGVHDQGLDIIAKRLLQLDGSLQDEVNSFRELREVQVLHILARERGADGTLDAKTHLHPTLYSIAPKKPPSELLWAMKWLTILIVTLHKVLASLYSCSAFGSP